MSVEAMSWVLNHAPQQGTDKLVLLGIANHADDRGRNAWPSVATLARYANVTERAVQASIGRLRDAGAIVVEAQRGGLADTRPDRRTNRYQVVMKALERGEADFTPQGERGEADDTPVSDHGVKPSAPRGEAQRANGVKPTSPEPSLNRPRTVQVLASAPLDAQAPTVVVDAEVLTGELVPFPGADAPAPKTRPRDDLWDALLEACGVDTAGIPSSARGAYNRARKDLADIGATPDEIHRRARLYRAKFAGATLTPTALARHWAELAGPAAVQSGPMLNRQSQGFFAAVARSRAAEGA